MISARSIGAKNSPLKLTAKGRAIAAGVLWVASYT